MTEKWVSTPKWFCRYCKVWIADNKPSRQHHEQGAKHTDPPPPLPQLKREMADIERAAKASFAQDMADRCQAHPR